MLQSETPRARDALDQRVHGAVATVGADREGHYSTRDFAADSLRRAGSSMCCTFRSIALISPPLIQRRTIGR